MKRSLQATVAKTTFKKPIRVPKMKAGYGLKPRSKRGLNQVKAALVLFKGSKIKASSKYMGERGYWTKEQNKSKMTQKAALRSLRSYFAVTSQSLRGQK